jgi:phenylalanyl-tRNA synthetase alpha subunit
MLYKLAQEKPFAPKRYYSIDRVFRNEAVDRTHLAEFHHIEGLICDYGLTLGDLIGVLEDFFSRLVCMHRDLRMSPSCVSSLPTIHTLNQAWKFSGQNNFASMFNLIVMP